MADGGVRPCNPISRNEMFADSKARSGKGVPLGKSIRPSPEIFEFVNIMPLNVTGRFLQKTATD